MSDNFSIKDEWKEYFYYNFDVKQFVENDNTVFVFDSNILLDMLRIDQQLVNAFFDILKNKKNYWIPYYVGYEFSRNHYKVYNNKLNSHQKFKDEMTTIKNSTIEEINSQINLFKIPKENSEVSEFYNNLDSNFNNLIEKTKSFIQTEEKLKENLNMINQIFKNNIGEKQTEKQVNEYIKEFDELTRNGMKLPGDKDKKIKKSNFPHQHYGDYIIFNQIVEYSKKTKKDILFVTGDLKEDWVIKRQNVKTTITPELRRLFNEKSNQDIWLIDLPGFLKLFDDIEIDSNLLDNYSLNYNSYKDKINRKKIINEIMIENLNPDYNLENNILYIFVKKYTTSLKTLNDEINRYIQLTDFSENSETYSIMKFTLYSCDNVILYLSHLDKLGFDSFQIPFELIEELDNQINVLYNNYNLLKTKKYLTDDESILLSRLQDILLKQKDVLGR